MKFIDRAKATILNTRKSFERFPVTIVLSILFTGLLIYNFEVGNDLTNVARDNLIRLTMVSGLGLLLSLCIGLLNERLFRARGKSILTYIIGGLILIGYYFFLLDKFEMVQMTRFFGTILFLVVSVVYILKLKNDINYESYVIKVFSGVFITILYSAVLYFGLSVIFFTVDNLFDIDISGKIYLYTFFIVVFIFGVSLFLSKLPEKDDDFKDYIYSKSLKVLLLYIVIPLISVYTVILYAYFIKILITWVWPKGLVSHLVLWYSAVSAGVIFLITPLLEENKLAKTFKIFFPKFILPILVMMFISIWQRINQYGITENRYYILVLGLWVLGIMLYFNFKKPLKNIIIPISLSIVIFISLYGPVSSYSMSKMSQNHRLNRILENNGLITNGALVANPNVSKDDQKEISNIISYFNNNHSLADIKAMPNDFEVEDTKKLLGFEYSPVYGTPTNIDYFSYYLNNIGKQINISGYDYFLNISSWDTDTIHIEKEIEVKYSKDHILTVEKVGKDIINVDINKFAEEMYNNKNSDKQTNDIDKMTFTVDNKNIQLKIVFNNLYGQYNKETKEFNLKNAEFMLFIK